MNELISIAVLVATLYAGTVIGEKIFVSVRTAALTKAARGIPSLSLFAKRLTHSNYHTAKLTPVLTGPTKKENHFEQSRESLVKVKNRN